MMYLIMCLWPACELRKVNCFVCFFNCIFTNNGFQKAFTETHCYAQRANIIQEIR